MNTTAATSRRVLVSTDERISVPEKIALCPYCNARLHVYANGWRHREDGTWEADSIDVECESEPDIDSGDWWGWHRVHSYMPYVHQLPVNRKIEMWVAAKYDFDLKEN